MGTERWYGAGGEEMAPWSLANNWRSAVMPQLNDDPAAIDDRLRTALIIEIETFRDRRMLRQ